MVKILKKQYETPNEAWNQERIDTEDRLREEFGLKNKKEIYKAYSELRSVRRQARKLIGSQDETQEEEVLNKANRLGLVKSNAGLEDLLTLQVEDFLQRRLQSAVLRRGYADTPLQARQLVTHGHVKVDGETVNIPGKLLTQEEEKSIEVEEPDQGSEETDTEETEETEDSDDEDKEEVNEE